MAFSFDINNVPANGCVAMFILKRALKAAGWTVPKSSDGSTYNSSGDQITSGSSGANGMYNTRAWYVVAAPNGRQICIQRDNQANGQGWRIKYSPAAGFVTGSPSATQAPAAADEKMLIGGGTDASPTFGTTFLPGDNGYKYHVVCGGAAEGYCFIGFLAANTTGSTTSGTLFLDSLVANSYPVEDVDPVVLGVPALLTFASLSSTGMAAQISAATFTGCTALAPGTTPGAMGTNPWTGKDDLLPVFYARTAATVGFKGLSYMLRWGSATRGNMDLATDKTRVFIGNIWIPWDGVTNPVL